MKRLVMILVLGLLLAAIAAPSALAGYGPIDPVVMTVKKPSAR